MRTSTCQLQHGRHAQTCILASMHDAMLDDARWPGVSALIDETCGLTGNDLTVREGPQDDVRILFVGAYCRGQRREDQERDYLENYYPTDERVPRVRLASGGCPTAIWCTSRTC